MCTARYSVGLELTTTYHRRHAFSSKKKLNSNRMLKATHTTKWNFGLGHTWRAVSSLNRLTTHLAAGCYFKQRYDAVTLFSKVRKSTHKISIEALINQIRTVAQTREPSVVFDCDDIEEAEELMAALAGGDRWEINGEVVRSLTRLEKESPTTRSSPCATGQQLTQLFASPLWSQSSQNKSTDPRAFAISAT
jgi:hypothetical protein